MSVLSAIQQEAKTLPKERQKLLLEFAEALHRNIKIESDPKSDICSRGFAENFGARLLVYHAFHEQKMTKKTFEYAMKRAAIATGKKAKITASQTNPGEDIIIDGERFSLKTEGAKSMSKSKITISKLMEARWIRECEGKADFCKQSKSKILSHLNSYSRILSLRAFDPQDGNFTYELVEIPLSLLNKIGTLSPSDFSDRSKSGGSRATISEDGQNLFTLTLDGSVEKITVSNLLVSECRIHGRWEVPKML